MSKHWFPLESNPEVMTSYASKLGLDTSLLSFYDVLSTEEWALAMLPDPVVGVLMLFPIKDNSEEYNKQEDERIKTSGQIVSPNVYFMKQIVGNACGTVGILHAIINAKFHPLTQIASDSYIQGFIDNSTVMNAEERAVYLNNDNSIETFHEEAAATGQSEVISEVNSHFVAFTCVDGSLYELDGRKNFPINHGPCAPDSLMSSACRVIQGFMERDPGELGFTVVALAKTTNLDDE